MPVPLSAFTIALEVVSASVPSPDALLLQALLAAAVRLSGLPAPPVDAPAPVLVELPAAELRRQACPERPRTCMHLIAWHDAAAGRVLLSDQLDWRMRPVDRSFVLHELVHVLQARRPGSPRDDDCARALDDERLAYRVQNAWLDEQGRTERFGGRLHVLRCAAAQVDAEGRMLLRRAGDGDAEALIGDLMRRRGLSPPETSPPPPGTAP
ncbi:hypothetical protein ACU6VI_00935 [Sphaerotilus natans]|uniref:hypothetical protein n=1 Tax=Sphaerotilus natans TaxID=34103 RepID=UPI00406D2DAA